MSVGNGKAAAVAVVVVGGAGLVWWMMRRGVLVASPGAPASTVAPPAQIPTTPMQPSGGPTAGQIAATAVSTGATVAKIVSELAAPAAGVAAAVALPAAAAAAVVPAVAAVPAAGVVSAAVGGSTTAGSVAAGSAAAVDAGATTPAGVSAAGAGGMSGMAIGLTVGIGAAVVVGYFIYRAHRNETKGDREDFAESLGFKSDSTGTQFDHLFNYLISIDAVRGAELRNTALNVIGKHDTDANVRWMHQVLQLMGLEPPAQPSIYLPYDAPLDTEDDEFKGDDFDGMLVEMN